MDTAIAYLRLIPDKSEVSVYNIDLIIYCVTNCKLYKLISSSDSAQRIANHPLRSRMIKYRTCDARP